MTHTFRESCPKFFKTLQLNICSALEVCDDSAVKFELDEWQRLDSSGDHGGGGLTRILRNGKVFEQAGVNFSEVHGVLPPEMVYKLSGKLEEKPFYATGVSLVIHPWSPCIPTTHANFRYLEVDNLSWFGGGADLTPYILERDDARHFHQTLKSVCDEFDPSYYPRFKKECDEYFYIKHRKETRGIGGIFYDYLGKDDPSSLEKYFNFSKKVASSFVEAYIPIVERRKNNSYTDRQKEFQLLRRGRYIEFNLVYDRGTQFGLHTNGRTESILMSIPPIAKWQYEGDLAITDEERELEQIFRNPIDWV